MALLCKLTQIRAAFGHVGADADDVALAGFAGRVLQVDAVAEVAGLGPRLDEGGGEVEAADDDGSGHLRLRNRYRNHWPK